MGCIDEELVQRFLGGDLSVDRLSEVERHIDGCKSCFQLVVTAAAPSSAHPADAGEGAPPPGTVIASRYRVLSLLGLGASGHVFEAFDQLAQVPVALKALRPALAADPKWVVRLTRELQIARRIDHRHVCRVLDLEEADGRRFLVMELAAGSLRAELGRGKVGSSPQQALRDARAIVAGLQAIHREGIVHRDVKPENVLRMPDGRLVLSDFGLAAIPRQQASLTLFVGTPSYMAPELAQGEAATVASDIWSLGVVLHELLLGGRPRWKSEAGRRTLTAPPAAGLFSGDPEIEGLCAACLSAVPEERPASAAEIEARLAAVAVSGKRPRGRSWKRPAPLAIIAAAGVLLGAGALTARMLLRRPPAPVAAVPPAPPPARPLVLYRGVFTEATPAWARTIATRLVSEALGRIPGIELRPWSDNDRGARKAGLRPWLVGITSGQSSDRPGPKPMARSGIPVEVSIVKPDGSNGALSNEACPAKGFAECLQDKTVGFIKGSLQQGIAEDLNIERARRESSGRARAALDLYFKVPEAERTSGKSIEALQYLDSALQSQPESFPALLERVRFFISNPRSSLIRNDWLLPAVESLRKKRPREPGVATVHCRALTVQLLDATHDDRELKAAEDACGQAQTTEIDDHLALFSLAQLKARRCDAQGALDPLQRIFDDHGSLAFMDYGIGSFSTPPSAAGRDVSALLLVSSLPPLENRSKWLMNEAIINAADAAASTDAPRGYAEAHFRRALTESRAQSLWSGGSFSPRDAHRAAAIRGLMTILRARGESLPRDLSRDLEDAESGWDWGKSLPFDLLPYYWVDRKYIRQLLGNIEPVPGCTSAIQKALLLQALGDREGRDAALAACKDDHAWIRSCRALLSGPIARTVSKPVRLSPHH
jgi:serine/threonine protein kinase